MEWVVVLLVEGIRCTSCKGDGADEKGSYSRYSLKAKSMGLPDVRQTQSHQNIRALEALLLSCGSGSYLGLAFPPCPHASA